MVEQVDASEYKNITSHLDEELGQGKYILIFPDTDNTCVVVSGQKDDFIIAVLEEAIKNIKRKAH